MALNPNTPAIDVAKWLATVLATYQSVTWTYATNVFDGPVRPAAGGIPAAAIFVLSETMQNTAYLGSSAGASGSIYQYRIQVRVRYPSVWNVGDIIAEAIYDAMNKPSPLPTPAAGTAAYFSFRSGAKHYLGEDLDTHNHEWSINAVLESSRAP